MSRICRMSDEEREERPRDSSSPDLVLGLLPMVAWLEDDRDKAGSAAETRDHEVNVERGLNNEDAYFSRTYGGSLISGCEKETAVGGVGGNCTDCHFSGGASWKVISCMCFLRRSRMI